MSDASLCLLGPLQQPALPPQQQHQGSVLLPPAAPPPAGLQSLSASGLSVTDATLARLPCSLTALTLRDAKRVGDAGLLQLLLQCPRLARLDATGCSQLTAAGFGVHTPFGQQGGTEQANSSGSGDRPGQQDAEPRLQAFRQVVSTAAGVQLQRAALPKQACTREVLAWLAGLASGTGGGSSSSSSGGSSRLPGWAPLQRLELASCGDVEEGDLVALAACCPQLKALSLPWAGAAAGATLCSALTRSCRLLQLLNMTRCERSLADADLALLLDGLPALQHLDCSGHAALAGSPFVARQQAVAQAATAELAAHAQARQRPARRSFVLRTLRLDSSLVDDAAVVGIAATCPHLETLSMRGCQRMTPASMVAVLWLCSNLRQLCLGNTRVADPSPSSPIHMPPSFHAAAAALGVPCDGDPLALLAAPAAEGRAGMSCRVLSAVELPRRGCPRGSGSWAELCLQLNGGLPITFR